jgi:FAD/FMN-containing dehydrogenase
MRRADTGAGLARPGPAWQAGAMLNPADPAFVSALAAALPAGILSEPEPRHLAEPRGRWRGQAGTLARPRSTTEVAAVVSACAAARVGIVPWGGGTGLVGGQIAPAGPPVVLLSLERLRALRDLSPGDATMTIEAGATLAAAQAAATGAGRLLPLSLASEGTATVGGVLATNAGGVNVIRWGNARDLCLGLEAVMADGRIWHGLRRLRKDNAGYDLRHLLIGSEGTLGIITAAVLRLLPPPAAVGAALVAVPGPAAALRLLALAEEVAGGCVSAFEIMHRTGFDFIAETIPGLRPPLDPMPDWSALIDIGLPAGLDPAAVLATLWERAAAAGLASDGVIAASAAQRAALWHLRESIPEANRRIGAVASHDIAVPLGAIPAFIAAADAALAALGPWRINCFGHLGDGNLHYNVFPAPGRTRADHLGDREAVKACVHNLVHGFGGSVSAEHGVGRLKTGDLQRYGDPVKLAAMRAIKAALDPAGILNPGAVIAAGAGVA